MKRAETRAPGTSASGARQAPLLLVGDVEKCRKTDSCFGQLPWRVRRLPTVLEFSVQGPQLAPQVIVCEDELPDGNWRTVLELAAAWRNPAPLIVTSRLADERLWAEVLNLGGYDLLAKPLRKQEVERALLLAWEYASRRSQPWRPPGRATAEDDLRTCSTA